MNKVSKEILIGIIIVLALGAIGFWYWSQQKGAGVKKETGAVGATQEVSKSVPEIQTNPAQKVPEINPLDRANPFKYKNPLR